MKRAPILWLVAALVACERSAPTDPCDRDLACAVAGVDIAILDVEPQWTAAQDYDAALDMRVVQPGDEIEVEVLVMNRGTIDATRPATITGVLLQHERRLFASAQIEPLAVGERATYTLVFEMPAGPRFVQWQLVDPHPESVFRLEHDGYEDADASNDERAAGFEFLLDAPVLEFHLTGLPDTMLGQHAYPATLAVRNHSTRRAFAGGLEIAFCADYEYEIYCDGGILEQFSPMTIGAIPAGITLTLPVTLRPTKDALWYFDAFSTISVMVCQKADGPRACWRPGDFDQASAYDIAAAPDHALECEPPLVADGASFDVASALCSHIVGDRTWAVARFDPAPGHCWRAWFTSASSGQIAIHDPSLERLPYTTSLDCAIMEQDDEHLVIVRPATSGGAPAGSVRVERMD